MLNPRRRTVPRDIVHTILAWAEAASATSVTVSDIQEWVSLDYRTVPHVLWLTVERPNEPPRRISIGKAFERVTETDLCAALWSVAP